MALLLLNSLFLPTDIINIVKINKSIDFSIKNKYQENASSLLIKLNNQVLIFNLINHPTFDYNYKDFETGNNLIILSAISQPNNNDINTKNENALIISTKGGCIDSVKLLLKYHININQQDISGNTALHYALILGDKYLIKLLCQKKADYNIKNNEDLTPSLYALRIGNKEIISVMTKPKKEIKRSKYNVSKVSYDKNKNNFYKELIFKNSNQNFYPLNIDKKELLRELVIGLSTL
ncbi:ankyrin [Piromyces finnis]|uniref:Ankyrin n=1 Tax=Piromyces finnis TaxID=1754191 RepID=A0A1Y1VNC5_9FUNG|nr:ankyrin [Piromyces finnis]|eukprot:ORX60780.1 ankyrin [Piromyces finnis]